MSVCEVCGNELRAIENNTPFKCKVCGGIDFPFKPTRDIVFIYPDPVKDLPDGLVLPPVVKANMQSEIETGTVLAVGKGYWDKKGKFHPVNFRVGDRVIFDKTCPWWMDVEAPDGSRYLVRYMGSVDVKCKIEEN